MGHSLLKNWGRIDQQSVDTQGRQWTVLIVFELSKGKKKEQKTAGNVTEKKPCNASRPIYTNSEEKHSSIKMGINVTDFLEGPN